MLVVSTGQVCHYTHHVGTRWGRSVAKCWPVPYTLSLSVVSFCHQHFCAVAQWVSRQAYRCDGAGPQGYVGVADLTPVVAKCGLCDCEMYLLVVGTEVSYAIVARGQYSGAGDAGIAGIMSPVPRHNVRWWCSSAPQCEQAQAYRVTSELIGRLYSIIISTGTIWRYECTKLILCYFMYLIYLFYVYKYQEYNFFTIQLTSFIIVINSTFPCHVS